MNKNKSRLALACAAVVAAAGATVAAAPAQASSSLTQSVSAVFNTGPLTLNAVEHCDTDADGNTKNCTGLTLPAPAEKIELALSYAISSAGSTTVLPNVLSRAGTRGCQSLDSTGNTVYRTGVTLLAGPAQFTSGKREVKINGQAKPEAGSDGSDTPVRYVSHAICVPAALASSSPTMG